MKIHSLCMAALFTFVGVIYISSPFQQSFDVQDTPDSPPSASLVSSMVTAVDAIADSPIDVRPPYSMKIFWLS
jgi:hypothetical protein